MKTILQIEDRNPNKDNIHKFQIKLRRRDDWWWALGSLVKNLMKFSMLLYLQHLIYLDVILTFTNIYAKELPDFQQ